MHYKGSPLDPHRPGLADDEDFFNSPNGATNPEAELNATLAVFFDPPSAAPSIKTPAAASLAAMNG